MAASAAQWGLPQDSHPLRRQAVLRKTTGTTRPQRRAAKVLQQQQYEYRDTVCGVPYVETFDKAWRLNYFTIIDANADGTTWQWGTTSRGGNPCASYPYNSKNPGDDWLISPDVKLEAGHLYKVSFDACCQGTAFHEKFVAKWGQGKTVEAMTNDLVDETEVGTWNSTTFSREIAIKADGNYNFGIHCVSDKDKGHLYIDNLKVEEVSLASAPDSVTSLKVTPDPQGKLSATVSFNAPTKDVEGNDLTKLDYVTVYNSDRLVERIDNPTPGAALSVTDSKAAHAPNMYIVTPYVGELAGKECTAVQFVGIDKPFHPNNAVAADLISQVKLTWDKVSAVGVNGGVVVPEKTGYLVYNVTDEGTLGEKIDSVGTTSYTFDYDTTTGEQNLVQWGIQSVNSRGRSSAVGVSLVKGQSYGVPFKDSFSDDDDHIWWLDMDGDADGWAVTSDKSADGDMASATVSVGEGETTSLMSGKIALTGLTDPAVRFKCMMNAQSDSRLTLFVLLPSGKTEDVATIEGDGGKMRWMSQSASLAKFKDEPYVVLGFKAQADKGSKGAQMWVDQVSVDQKHSHDLAITLKADEDVRKGRPITGTLSVENTGFDKHADGFDVKIYKDGQEIETYEGGSLDGWDDLWTRQFSIGTTARDNDFCTLKAVVEMKGDEVASNNEAETTVKFRSRELPSPQNVRISGNTITWAEPEIKTVSVADGFEDYKTWTNHFGDWTVVDANHGLASGLIHGIPYPNQGTAVGMQIFNFNEVVEGLTSSNPYVVAHSGVQFVGSPLVTDENGNFTEVDNWLISPHLSGRAQTITFYANNLRGAADQTSGTYENYPERVQVLASSTDKAPSSFVPVGDAWWVNNGAWTSYSFNLPHDTKYFAIHHLSDDQHAVLLFIDDVTFDSSVGKPVAYNIYDGNNRIGSVEGNICTYTLKADADSAGHNYYVSASYDEQDESGAVCAATVSGIDAVTDDTKAGNQKVYSVGGTVYDNMPAAHGIYIKGGKKILNK